jgi:hypothetical protein
LQLPQPESQAPIWQVPALQLPLAWLYVQASPQSEQLAAVPNWVSQPSASDELQSPHPELQAPIWQVPPLQLPLALG